MPHNGTVHSNAADVIYDSAGNKLLRGVPYYVLPLFSGSGGGLTLSRTTIDSCPLDVTQEPFDLSKGVPFTITPNVFDEDYVREAYPVTIEADVTDPCRGSNIMKVTTSDNGTKGFKSATIGGESNKPESCFQLVEADMMPGLRSYQIQLCPFKCGTNTSTSLNCYNVGLVANDVGKKFLATTEVIYPVVLTNSFVKPASQSSTSSL
ncbi:proteinase inhibitor I3 [Artemisia annua]|uniref:Proteinase inhibitor I3 n=1 Tax=Artemisia annua TaxID=35608 RepID=A0A2U1LZY9_ARTAN|nr:proteinase inhibitor I3 [Artemisia annua]